MELLMKTILIVDDSPFMREICSGMLRKHKQYSLLEAGNGEECLQAALDHKPDLVLMDIEMEGQDGLEICQILNSDVSYHQPFIVLMSAHRLDEIETEALRIGADGVLEKPLNWLQLRAMIYSLLGE
jgi:CheY-like chemotaxis protein